MMIQPPTITFAPAIPSMSAATWLDEATLRHRAAEATAIAAKVQSPKLRIHCLEVAKTYHRLAKMRRRLAQERCLADVLAPEASRTVEQP